MTKTMDLVITRINQEIDRIHKIAEQKGICKQLKRDFDVGVMTLVILKTRLTDKTESVDYEARLEESERILTDERNYLMSMIEWLVAAHGESVTTEYNDSQWALKDYVSENLLGEYLEIRKNSML